MRHPQQKKAGLAINIGEILKDLAALPLHPMLVHFPIALFIAAFLMESLRYIFKKEDLHQAAVYVYVLAVLMTPLTVWAGLAEEKRLNLHHPLLEAHEELGTITMWAGLVSLSIMGVLYYKKIRYPSWLFISVLILLVGLTITTAFYGGRMVYEYGVGMEQ